jgi:hypothetical protein
MTYEPAFSRTKSRLNGQRVRGPGEDSAGASAEREWGCFGPQPKAELERRASTKEQGKYEVLARHGRTPHHPAVGRGVAPR